MNRSALRFASLTWLAGLAMLLGLCGPARAGYWELDRYVWSAESHAEDIKWRGREGSSSAGESSVESNYVFNKTRSCSNVIEPISPHAQQEYAQSAGCGTSSADGSASDTWLRYGNQGDFPSSMNRGEVSGKAHFVYSVRAVFRWNGDIKEKDPVNHGLFIHEEASLCGFETVNADRGKPFTLSGIKNSLSSAPHAVVQPWGDGSFNPNAPAAIYYIERAQAITNIGGQEAALEVSGPTRTFSGTIDLKPGYTSDLAANGVASLYPNYSADVAHMSIAIQRRKAAVPPSSGPLNTASIAAGGFDTAPKEHWADVFVTFSPPLAGQKIVMHRGQISGYEKEAAWAPNKTPFTDADGRVRIGAWLSSDLFVGNGELRVQQHKGDPMPVAKYRQAWDEDSDGHLGGEKHWQYDQIFEYGKAIPVTFRPSFLDNWSYGGWSYQEPIQQKVPITRHTLNFMAGRLRVSGFSGSYAYPQTWIFTSNRSEANPHPWNGPPIVFAPQRVLDQYAYCTPRQVTDSLGKGIYTTTMIVPEPPVNRSGEPELVFGNIVIRRASIEHVGLKAQDDGVYEFVPGLVGSVEDPPEAR